MHRLSFLSFYCIVYILAGVRETIAITCNLKSPCKCGFPSGEELDLTPLNSANIYKPPGNVTQYFYLPCPTGETSCPKNAAFCSKSGDFYEILGTVQNVSFGKNVDSTNYVQYSVLDGNNKTRTTLMILQCSTSSNNTIEPDPLVPGRFVLRSKAACPIESGPGTDDNEEFSLGSVFVLLFVIFGSLYLFGGMAILKFIRGASGVEIIPHYEFWADLPGLVRDGILFTRDCCNRSASYDRI